MDIKQLIKNWRSHPISATYTLSTGELMLYKKPETITIEIPKHVGSKVEVKFGNRSVIIEFTNDKIKIKDS